MAQGVPAEAMKSLPSTTVRVLKWLPSIDGKEVATPHSPHVPHNVRTDIAVALCSSAILPLLCTHETIAGHPAQMQGVQIEARQTNQRSAKMPVDGAQGKGVPFVERRAM